MVRPDLSPAPSPPLQEGIPAWTSELQKSKPKEFWSWLGVLQTRQLSGREDGFAEVRQPKQRLFPGGYRGEELRRTQQGACLGVCGWGSILLFQPGLALEYAPSLCHSPFEWALDSEQIYYANTHTPVDD